MSKLFNPFDSLTKEQLATKDKAAKEYLRRRVLIFDVFTTPKGKELMRMMQSVTVDRPFNLDAPRSADEQVAFQTAYAEKKSRDGFVRQLLAQMEQERKHRAALTHEEKDHG